MLRSILQWSCLFVLILLASLAAAQSEFSADVVDFHKDGSQNKAKIYFAKDKVRVDSQSRDPRNGGSVIMNLSAQTMVVVMSQQHMYMDMPVQMQQQRQMFHFFRVGDVEDACAEWLNLVPNKGGSCHKTGSDTVNGRSTIVYEGTDGKGQSNKVWLDSKLRFPVKWQNKDGNGGELQNIQEGSQPGNLFEIPAGYTKMEMPAGVMMQQPH